MENASFSGFFFRKKLLVYDVKKMYFCRVKDSVLQIMHNTL